MKLRSEPPRFPYIDHVFSVYNIISGCSAATSAMMTLAVKEAAVNQFWVTLLDQGMSVSYSSNAIAHQDVLNANVCPAQRAPLHLVPAWRNQVGVTRIRPNVIGISHDDFRIRPFGRYGISL